MILFIYIYYPSNRSRLVHRLESSVVALLHYHESQLDLDTLADVLSRSLHVFKFDGFNLVEISL
jgi:hypothetical protein